MSDPQPWHFTTLLDLVDHWQTLFAGVLAVGEAWRTIRATVESARAERAGIFDAWSVSRSPEAVSALAERPFDPAEFPFSFLEAFGNKETTLKRLRKGESNKSDLGGVLQTNNIHIAVTGPGEVPRALAALKASPATARAKAKFILAADGEWFEAEDLVGGETVARRYPDFPDHFGFFLPLAGISTVQQISENAFDIRATSRLNRLYVELLKGNPDWGAAARRPDMNHFMARLIFCFFAEDTRGDGGCRHCRDRRGGLSACRSVLSFAPESNHAGPNGGPCRNCQSRA
jgi:hypothetical protein